MALQKFAMGGFQITRLNATNYAIRSQKGSLLLCKKGLWSVVNNPPDLEALDQDNDKQQPDAAGWNSVLGAAIGLGATVVGVPVALSILGFGGAGIAAGSIGAKMMSAAAIANGGGVASGGLVATLQSIGAAGVPTTVSAAITATGAVLGALKDIYG